MERFARRHATGGPDAATTSRFEHLVEMPREAYTRRPVVATKAAPRAAQPDDPLAPFGPAVRAWFEATFEAPTPAQAEGWAAIAQRPPHADPRPDRQRQDPRRVPVVPGPAGRAPPPGADEEQPGDRPRAVRQPAQGADLRRRAQPPRPARGHRPRSRTARHGTPEHPRRIEDRRHARRRASRPRAPPAGHPRHHPREPVPPAHEPGARDPQRRRARDRRRGPRDRRHQARRTPGAEPGTPRDPAGRGRQRRGRRASGDGDGGGDARARPIQRIGLSATQRPLETIARYLGGHRRGPRGEHRGRRHAEAARAPGRRARRGHGEARRGPADGRAARRPGARRRDAHEHLARDPPPDPASSSGAIAARSCSPTAAAWPSASRSGSTSSPARSSSAPITASSRREQRLEIEEELKAGRLPALVATSSLELGIDMGAVDLVIQVESPTSVARGLQRIGRAGHQVGEPSKGVIFPKYRGDLLETAVVVKGMHDGVDRADDPAAQPARRPRPAAGGDDDRRAVHRRRAARHRPPRRPVRDPDPRGPRGRPRHAVGRVPVRRVRRAQAARDLGPPDRHDRRAAGCPRGRRDQRRHDPGPRPVPGLPRGRAGHHRQARRRARRGDGLRAAGRDARRRRGPRRELAGASRRSAPTA